MARSQEPANGSDHPIQNGVKARRAGILLFIVATFGIMAILAFPLRRNIRVPLPQLPRPLQAALSPAERLIRPIVPWLGPLPGTSNTPPLQGPPVAALPGPISQPAPPPPGEPSPQPPPSEQPPPPPPGGGTAGDIVRKPVPPRGTVGDTARKYPGERRPGSGAAADKPAKSDKSDTTRGRSSERSGKSGKRAKPGKHSKKKKQGKHSKRAKHGSAAKGGNGRKKG